MKNKLFMLIFVILALYIGHYFNEVIELSEDCNKNGGEMISSESGYICIHSKESSDAK